MELLLARGVSCNTVNDEGSSPLLQATQVSHHQTLALLMPTFLYSLQLGNTHLVQLLLDHNADISTTFGPNQLGVLHIAAQATQLFCTVSPHHHPRENMLSHRRRLLLTEWRSVS